MPRKLADMTTMDALHRADRDHAQVLHADVPSVVRELDEILGSRLVAYIGGVKETRAVRQWSTGDRTPSAATQTRLRTALQTARLLQYREARPVIQAWFQGMNPHLEDHSPARVLRDADIDAEGPHVMTAARAFAQHG